ncbi:MAG: CvfB family protein, partial [Oceanobacter sp.]
MLIPGCYYRLTCTDRHAHGVYLEDEEQDRVLLPTREVPDDCVIGDQVRVFVYFDSEDRLIATTKQPKIQLNQVAMLEVADVNNTGAFLEWGLPKDLFVPFAEQTRRMEEGKKYLVYLCQDNTGRLIGTTRLNRHIEDQVPDALSPNYANGKEVKLYFAQQTDLGFKAVVDHKYWGLLHSNDIRTAVRPGQNFKGYVKRLREDGRIDLSLEPVGHQKTQALAPKILAKLQRSNGYLAVSDKSPADLIELHFACSKRAYKAAIGRLFAEQKIIIEADGIRLASEQGSDQRVNKSQPLKRKNNRLEGGRSGSGHKSMRTKQSDQGASKQGSSPWGQARGIEDSD